MLTFISDEKIRDQRREELAEQLIGEMKLTTYSAEIQKQFAVNQVTMQIDKSIDQSLGQILDQTPRDHIAIKEHPLQIHVQGQTDYASLETLTSNYQTRFNSKKGELVNTEMVDQEHDQSESPIQQFESIRREHEPDFQTISMNMK